VVTTPPSTPVVVGIMLPSTLVGEATILLFGISPPMRAEAGTTAPLRISVAEATIKSLGLVGCAILCRAEI
jgi:hypothetical protein